MTDWLISKLEWMQENEGWVFLTMILLVVVATFPFLFFLVPLTLFTIHRIITPPAPKQRIF